MPYVPMSREQLDDIIHKAAALDPDDPDRRGILEYAAAWFSEKRQCHRKRIEREIRKRARRLAY